MIAQECLSSSEFPRKKPILLDKDEFDAEFNRLIWQDRVKGSIECQPEKTWIRLGSACRLHLCERGMVVFESWYQYRHHTRIFEQPINELTAHQRGFIDEISKRSATSIRTKPRTKKEEKREALQGRVEAAIAQATPEHKPLFPTAKPDEEKTISETPVPSLAGSPAPDFF